MHRHARSQKSAEIHRKKHFKKLRRGGAFWARVISVTILFQRGEFVGKRACNAPHSNMCWPKITCSRTKIHRAPTALIQLRYRKYVMPFEFSLHEGASIDATSFLCGQPFCRVDAHDAFLSAYEACYCCICATWSILWRFDKLFCIFSHRFLVSS